MALKPSIKALWGISDIGFSMMSTMENVFFMIFLTDVAQLPLAITGIIAGSSAIIDAISAVVAGIVIDKVTFKNGKYRPWLLFCPPIVTVFFILMFTKVGGDIVAALIISVGYIMSHFVWNISWTANRNLIGSIGQNQEERSWLSARIAMGSSIGKLAVSYLLPIMTSALFAVFAVSGGSTPVIAYTLAAAIVAVLYLICYYIHYCITKGCDASGSAAKAVTFKDMAKAIVSNDQLVVVLLHDAIRLIAYYGVATMSTYYAKCVLGSSADSSIILLFFYLGCIIGSALSAKFNAKFGTKKTTLIGVIGWLVCQAAVIVLPANLFAVSAALFVGQILFGISYGLTSNLYTMCGTYGEWKTGGGARGVTMAFCSLAIKLGVAIRGVIIPVVLGMIAYDANAADPMIFSEGIKFGYSVLPVIFIAISLIPLIWFKLSDNKIIEMEKEIAERSTANDAA